MLQHAFILAHEFAPTRHHHTHNTPALSSLGGSTNCTALAGSCQGCLDLGKGGGCVWCPEAGGCVSAFACPGPANTCPVNYFWVISIWLVLSALICVCCLSCTTRRYVRG